MTAVIQDLKAGNPTLLPARESPYFLRGVYQRVVDTCRQELILDWGVGYLALYADEDTDSLDAQLHEEKWVPLPAYQGLENQSPWDRLMGKECGWTWVALNQQGFWDSALFSFDGIVPTILLQVIASSIEVFTITKH